jgi:hypothetical protein
MLYDLDVNFTFSWILRVNQYPESQPKRLREIPESRKDSDGLFTCIIIETSYELLRYVGIWSHIFKLAIA